MGTRKEHNRANPRDLLSLLVRCGVRELAANAHRRHVGHSFKRRRGTP